ncbi:MAG: hypothetical protein EXS08_14270 [Planctomycetes bacterium]|nr:hypothetical protein [Planctomycetota bacterium]
MLRNPTLLALLFLVLAPRLSTQQVNPADKQREFAQELQETPAADHHVNTWELEPTLVRGVREGLLREEDRIGDYGQPRWTAKRLFPATRVYVVPSGKVEFEHWTRVKVPEEGKSEVETQYELELGLPNRFQIDLYYVTSKTGEEGALDISEQKYELRYALADWGKLWMNPTLYLEYVERNAQADKVEYKLLLGDELAEGWHFGSNLVLEHELDGAGENEYELTAGLSHTVVDEKFSLGAEMKASLVDVHADRGDYTRSLEIGPSLQYRPLPQMHIDFAPLIGIGGDSRAADLYLVVGWEF